MNKIFAQLLRARGLSKEFLSPEYEQSSDLLELPDINLAVERIRRAVKKSERVLIYGDYDVDGVTASVVMYDALRLAGAQTVEVMLPNRFTDGYGMSERILERAKDFDLIVTVDCGSRNHEIITELEKGGVDVIVTDHHECGEDLPLAAAIVNPKRTDYDVPEELKNLAGVGVAFKVAQALVRGGLILEGQEKWLLDLVMIGTICDSMKLTGENRRLCYYGMKVLEKTRRAGLKELVRAAGLKNVDGEAIGFMIGPRLNAAGRMDTADKALDLLMARTRPEAAKLAMELEKLNKERRTQQETAVAEIERAGVTDAPVIVVKGAWHEGVIGIIAGKLLEKYRKPVFVFAEKGEIYRGSGRSFGEFNLAEALTACKEEIVGGGGHAEACGVKVKAEKLADFEKAINDYYRSLKLKDQEKFLRTQADIVIENVSDLSLELVAELKKLEPFGEGNPEPVFLLSGVRIVDVAWLGSENEHLRLTVWDRNGEGLKLMQFYAPKSLRNLRGGEIADILITLKENEYRGIRSVEGRIVEVKTEKA